MTEPNIERDVLGLAMVSSRALRDLDMVRPEHFHQPQAGAVWSLIQEMDSKGERIDMVTVGSQLGRIPTEKRRGINTAWLSECVTSAPVAAAAESRGTQLINAAELRALQAAVTRSQQLVDGAVDAVETTELVRAEIDATIPSTRTGVLLADGLPDTIAALRTETRVIPTPWQDLNKLIGGWRPGALYVIGARPGAGKTIMGTQAALDLARTGPVALNNLEMPAREIHQRMLAHVSEVNIEKFAGLSGGYDPLHGEWERVEMARDTLTALPLSVDDRAYVTVTDIRAHARSVSRYQPLAGVIVDYLQLMGTPRGDRRPRHEIIAGISRDLKLLAKEMQCPVIALSQLNRASEARAGGKPTLADLRESGAIEQDADVVLLLHVPEDDDGRPINDELNVLVAKNRHGSTGAVHLSRRAWISTLVDVAQPLKSNRVYGPQN